MSQHRLKKWDARAKTYLGLAAEDRAAFRAQFKKQEFNDAIVRVGTQVQSEYNKRFTKLKGIEIE